MVKCLIKYVMHLPKVFKGELETQTRPVHECELLGNTRGFAECTSGNFSEILGDLRHRDQGNLPRRWPGRLKRIFIGVLVVHYCHCPWLPFGFRNYSIYKIYLLVKSSFQQGSCYPLHQVWRMSQLLKWRGKRIRTEEQTKFQTWSLIVLLCAFIILGLTQSLRQYLPSSAHAIRPWDWHERDIN